jgi:thiol-disulfide isomerase/thioredoxin
MNNVNNDIVPNEDTENDNIKFSDDITLLNINTFDTHPNPKIVLFYAPWCHFCQDFSPIYNELAKKLPHIKLFAVDNDDPSNQPLFERYNVGGFPTILCITDNNHILYQGERTLSKLQKWITTQMKISTNITKQEVLKHKSELRPDNVIEIYNDSPEPQNGVVMFYAQWCGHCITMKPIFLSVAKDMPSVTFYMINGDTEGETNNITTLKEKYEIKGFPTVFFMKNGEKIVNFTENRTYEQLQKWIQQMISN